MFDLDPSACYNVMVDSRGRKIIVKEFYSASPSLTSSDQSSPPASNVSRVKSTPESSLNGGSWKKVSLGTTGDVLDIEEQVWGWEVGDETHNIWI